MSANHDDLLTATLAAGLGPSWDAAVPRSLHGYFAPARKLGPVTVLSSCTASPLSPEGRADCSRLFGTVAAAPSPAIARQRIEEMDHRLGAALVRLLAAPTGTRVFLTASLAEACLLLSVRLGALLRYGSARLAMPTIGEMASPLPDAFEGRSLPSRADIVLTEIPMRDSHGALIPQETLQQHYEAYKAKPDREVFVHASLGDATGLVGPWLPGRSTFSLDASQMRCRPDRVGLNLSMGLPVIVSGATFLGGPADSGALLVPPNRVPKDELRQVERQWRELMASDRDPRSEPTRGLSTVLRWFPALDNLQQTVALGSRADVLTARMTMELTAFLERFPDFHVFEGRDNSQAHDGGRDAGTVAFAVQSLKRKGRWLPMPDLIGLYHALAQDGVLIGPPVGIGTRGALRLAIGAPDILRGDIGPSLAHLETALHALGYRPHSAAPRRQAPNAGQSAAPEPRVLH